MKEKPELYIFQCNECSFIYAEPYDTTDRFAEFPECPDCGCSDVEIYNGEVPEDLQKAIEIYCGE